MDIIFEKGSQDSPKGHAFVYFRSSDYPDEVWASYLVMLPITVDLAKYMPPFLMNQMGDASIQDMSAFAFPPAPEKLEGVEQMEALADMRGDDILFGGSINTSDVPAMMLGVGDAVQRYNAIYKALVDRRGLSEAPADDAASEEEVGVGGFGVNDVMYGLMSDADRLNELTTLVGKLRFAVDNNEAALVKEAEDDIGSLSRHFEFDHKTSRIVQSVKLGEGDEDAQRLTMLYLQRCYHIIHEDYLALGSIEEQIAAIEGEASPSE